MSRQRGVALLTAMLMVVLVATLAASMLWQQWRGVEVETAQRTRQQAAWVLAGALDWARLILREDARQGGADHLAEPWAVPLESARLSTFLAAERGQTTVDDDANALGQAFLAGQMQDLQARLNVTNLIEGNKLHASSLAAWQRLFEHLNLPSFELEMFTQALLQSQAVAGREAQPGQPLQPRQVADLQWLGLSKQTLRVLQPYITLLPVRTTVNLNTAAPEVLLAVVPGMDMAQARALVQARNRQHMGTLADADTLVGNAAVRFDATAHGVASRFFSVTGQLRLDGATLQEVSVLQRDGLDVKVLSRQREVVASVSPTLQ